MADVRIRDLPKAFGAAQVFDGDSLDIADGEIVEWAGQSGCGKSTLPGMIDSNGSWPAVSARHGMLDGRKLVFGNRPEHLDLSDASIAAKVAALEPTWSETTIVPRFGNRDLAAVFRERHSFMHGVGAHLLPRVGSIHLLDTETGKRI